jgi:hypothetical protein
MMGREDERMGWPPEFARFATKEDAKEAALVWSTQQIKTSSFWIGLIVYSALVGLVVAIVLVLIRPWLQLPPGIFGGIVGGVTGGTGFVAMNVYWRQAYRRFLRQRLNEMGIPICMKCAYDLTGNTSGVCPECGTDDECETRGP